MYTTIISIKWVMTHKTLEVNTVHGKLLVGKKMANLANRELFTKIFLNNIHRYTKNVFGICTDCSLFTKFSLPIVWFAKIFPHQIFPVYGFNDHQLQAIFQPKQLNLVGQIYCTFSMRESLTICNNVNK